MRVIVFGSTGSVGRLIVTQAVAKGHEVTAFTRRPGKLTELTADVRVATGDILDFASVRQAVVGQDAVLCALGAPLSDRSRLRTNGTDSIVRAMEMEGVQRLISLSALGTGDSHSILPWYYRRLIIPLVMRGLYADHNSQEERIRGSSLAWTVVRPSSFVDGELTGRYHHGFATDDASLKLKISRADVADFMLNQLNNDAYIRNAVNVSY